MPSFHSIYSEKLNCSQIKVKNEMLCLNFCRQLRLASEQEGGARCGAGAGIVLARAANDPLVFTITEEAPSHC